MGIPPSPLTLSSPAAKTAPQQFQKQRGSVCRISSRGKAQPHLSLAELFEVEPESTSSELHVQSVTGTRGQSQHQQQWGYFQQTIERVKKEKALEEAMQIPFPTVERKRRDMPLQSFVIMGSC